MEDLYRVNKLIGLPNFMHDPLKTLKFKILASDCVIKKGVKTISLLIYYVKLYMLHPLISTLILET